MEPGKTYRLYTHDNLPILKFRQTGGFENLFKTEENCRYFLRPYVHFIPSVADTPAYQSSNVFTPTQKNLGGLSGLNEGLNRKLDSIEKRSAQKLKNLFQPYTPAGYKNY